MFLHPVRPAPERFSRPSGPYCHTSNHRRSPHPVRLRSDSTDRRYLLRARFPAAIRGRASSRSFRWEGRSVFGGLSVRGRRICPRCRRSSGASRPRNGPAKAAVQDTAVQGTERAERIRREEYLVFGAISDHHFGPVNHRRHIEREVFWPSEMLSPSLTSRVRVWMP